jgi:hypothetical protein
MHRSPRLLALLILLLAAGCGQGVRSAGQSPDAAGIPVDAALVTPRFGWVLTDQELLLTRDGGASFQPAALDLPAGSARAAAFIDATHGWAAAAAPDGTITVARTADAGGTWRAATVPAGIQISEVRLAFGDTGHGMVLARRATSPAFSAASLYATKDGGASWVQHTAPVAGDLAAEPDGTAWLAGGNAGDQLYRSTDLGEHWSRANLAFSSPVQSVVVARPVGGLLPVTVSRDGQNQVALLATDDGGSDWRETSVVPLRARGGPQVPAPVAVTSAGPLVVDPAGTTMYRVGAGGIAAAAPQPRGLPAGVERVTFAADGDRAGWALAASGTCAQFKQNCSIEHDLLATSDGGSSWRQVRHWHEVV